MKLSIVVCVYNTKREYFDACLKSIRESTLKKEDYELLVVDDGSSEDYSEIIEKYDPVYVKTDNRGLLSARLYAIMIAKGEYIAFCDADDTVSFNYYAPMIKKAEQTGADIVMNDWAFDTQATKYACDGDITVRDNIEFEGEDILSFFASGEGRAHSYFVQWNKIFKKSLLLKAKAEIEKTDAVSNKPFTFSEDALSNFFVSKNAKKLVNIHTGYYFYRIHDEQSVATKSKERLKNEIDQMALTFEIMLANLPATEYGEKIKAGLLSWRALMARKHYSYAKMQSHPDMIEYVREKYKQEKLELSKVKDSTVYIGTRLLGDNFMDIDRELYRLYKSNEAVNLIYNKKDKYVSDFVDYLISHEGKRIDRGAKKLIIVPKRKIKAKHKVIHNKFIYLCGLYMFKKGSKMRAFLKSKM
ncbi:MAG: glycosyltransferase family 2 protein [Clostridia bacterium]|nr:glycosyltransferase family 2 protein [Clostridia bacterium]